MNPDDEAFTKLLDGWVLCRSKSNPGRKYYFNRKTGKSSWSKPEAIERPCISKRATKMEKNRIQEKNKKEEIRKRALKRKSDGNYDRHSEEKCRKDSNHKDAQKKSILPQETNNKEFKRHYKMDSQKINNRDRKNKNMNTNRSSNVLTKNLANNRLSVLRSNLSKEAAEDNCKSNDSKRVKVSPKLNQSDTPVKNQRSELQSPNLNESKCTITSQSPSSDSLQSIPSPSQFFAANKIISSMKAQLPEEYNIKEKQKDTFADIEQGICNQMPEYPSNKHPATPPQFSEANKLVSAIKSKLTYKMSVPKEESVMTFASAKERMEVLRKSLTETTNTTEVVNKMGISEKIEPIIRHNNSKTVEESPEAMEVEDDKEIEPSRPQGESEMNNVSIIQTNFVLVVDTNIFIRELSFIKNVINSHIKGYSEKPTLLIPWRVINELDKLKDNNNGNGALCNKARAAMDFLYKSLPDNDRIKGQSLRDANNHIFPCEVPDDEILNCCLQQVERGKSVLLLTNDRNLCNKATINSVQRISLERLRGLIENEPKPVDKNSISVRMKHYEDTMFQLLANILESEMRSRYGGLWQHVVHRAPPWQLRDVLASLLKHWRTVFCEVFPRIDRLLADLNDALARAAKKPRALNESDVNSFKELCQDIAGKCRIIPEYMDAAKVAVEQLARFDNTPCADVTACSDVTVCSDITASPDDTASPDVTACTNDLSNVAASTNRLVEAFESVWTLYSSYCAKLSTCLGLPHSLEDKLPGNQPAEVLSAKWTMFRSQVNAFALAIKGLLFVENSDSMLEDQISRLETALKEGLALMSMDGSVVGRDELKIFCVKNRDMLQEAFTKLSQLTDLLDACKNNMSN